LKQAGALSFYKRFIAMTVFVMVHGYLLDVRSDKRSLKMKQESGSTAKQQGKTLI